MSELAFADAMAARGRAVRQTLDILSAPQYDMARVHVRTFGVQVLAALSAELGAAERTIRAEQQSVEQAAEELLLDAAAAAGLELLHMDAESAISGQIGDQAEAYLRQREIEE